MEDTRPISELLRLCSTYEQEYQDEKGNDMDKNKIYIMDEKHEIQIEPEMEKEKSDHQCDQETETNPIDKLPSNVFPSPEPLSSSPLSSSHPSSSPLTSSPTTFAMMRFTLEFMEVLFQNWRDPQGYGKWWSDPIQVKDIVASKLDQDKSIPNLGSIYIGAMPIHELNHENDIVSMNIKAVVSLNESWELEPFSIPWITSWTPLSFIDYQQMGITSVYLPTPDMTNPNLENITYGIQCIHTFLKKGENVLIHCKAGRGRSVFLAALSIYELVQDLGMFIPINDVFSFIESVRPQTSLNKRQTKALFLRE